MRESYIEQKFCRAVALKGGKAVKFVSPSYNGMPDRLVLLPHGKIFFVEVKAPGEKPTKLQQSRHRMLQVLGFTVEIIDNINQIEEVLTRAIT